MKLRVRCLDLDAGGKTIAIINEEDARELGVHPLERIILEKGRARLTVLVNMTSRFVGRGNIYVYAEVRDLMRLRDGDVVDAKPRPELASKQYIRKKIEGGELSYKEIRTIIDDIVARSLSDLEQAALVTALHIHGLTLNENLAFSKALVETSAERLRFPGVVVDKHGAGGIPGDKTTLLLVPIVAAAGLTIPKTSSRAITDPAGTADRAEVLMPVAIHPKKVDEVVRKVGGCIIWGGALKLAPADDLLIQIERPLALDPLIVPSVLAKKKIVGSKCVIIDLPTGPEAKMKTREEAERLAQAFISVGRKLGMRVECAITNADQPIGMAIGPALEAREALQAIMRPDEAPRDLVDKAISLAAILLGMVKRGNRATALRILKSGRAEAKLRQIIAAQGGRADIKPSDIAVEKKAKRLRIKSPAAGHITYISNRTLVQIARLAGAPKDAYAGVLLNKKLHESVRKGELLYTIYAERPAKLRQAAALARQNVGYAISTKTQRIVKEKIDHGVISYE
ncbi:MAG: thymidine phosphorylase [Candidatus Aenigmatarchaeota archaeon]